MGPSSIFYLTTKSTKNTKGLIKGRTKIASVFRQAGTARICTVSTVLRTSQPAGRRGRPDTPKGETLSSVCSGLFALLLSMHVARRLGFITHITSHLTRLPTGGPSPDKTAWASLCVLDQNRNRYRNRHAGRVDSGPCRTFSVNDGGRRLKFVLVICSLQPFSSPRFRYRALTAGQSLKTLA